MDIALVVALCAGLLCGYQLLRLEFPAHVEPALGSVLRPPPIATVIAAAVIAAVSALNLVGASDVLGGGETDGTTNGIGQLWRLISVLLAPGGGLVGTCFNLVFFVVLGVLAERVIGRSRLILGWCAGAVAGAVVGLAWQPLGVGHSVANLGLVGVLATSAGATRRPPVALIAPMVIVVISDVVMIAAADLHAAALTAGLAVSLLAL